MDVTTIALDVDASRGVQTIQQVGAELDAVAAKGVRAGQQIVGGMSQVSKTFVDTSVSVGQADAATQRFIGSTEGLTRSQQDLMAAGLSLEQVMAAVNGESIRAVVVTKQLTDSTRRMTLEQMKAIEMDAARTAAMNATAESINLTGAGFGRLRQSFATLAADAVGVPTIFGRVGASLSGAFGISSVVVIGVLAGISAIGYLFRAFESDSQKFANSVKDSMKQAADASTKAQLAMDDDQLSVAQKAYDKAEAAYASYVAPAASGLNGNAFAGGAGGVGADNLRRQRDDALKILMDWQEKKGQLDYQMGLEADKSATEQAAAFARGVDANAADRQRALDLEKHFHDEAVALGKSQTDNVRRVADLQNASSLHDALNLNAGNAGPNGGKAVGVDANELVGGNLSLEAQTKQLDVMRQVAAADADAYLQQQKKDALMGQEGESLALLTVNWDAYIAEQKAYASESGDVLTQHLAQIDANRKDADARIVATKATKDQADAQAFLNAQMAVVSKIGADKRKATTQQLMQPLIDATTAAQKQVDTMLKDMQRSLASFFDDVFTKGITSFTSLFSQIKDLFLKMIADMVAADIMKKIGGSVAGVIAGVMGTAATAGAQTGGGPAIPDSALGLGGSSWLKTAGTAGIMGLGGFSVGSAFGGLTTNSVVGALGGAGSGAAFGAGIGAMGGPIGIAFGSIIGGAAGLVGGFLGAQHSAEALAKAQLAQQMADTSVASTLASWRAQITGTAADQKAAAILQAQVQYDQIYQTIEQTEAGKKNADQRNKELAEAAVLNAENMKALQDNTSSLLQNTDTLNASEGYKLALQEYNYSPFVQPVNAGSGGNTGGNGSGSSGTAPAGGGSTGGGDDGPAAFTITVNTVLDGKIVATSVVNQLRKVAQATFGNTSQVADAMGMI